MAIKDILSEIDAEIASLQRARALLATLDGASAKAASSAKKAPAAAKPRRKRRALSAEARKKISEAQQKRWAKQRAKGKPKS
jgi:hypothetical protein